MFLSLMLVHVLCMQVIVGTGLKDGTAAGGEEEEGEGDDWGDWFDAFVVQAAAKGTEAAIAEEEEEEEEEGEEEGGEEEEGEQEGQAAGSTAAGRRPLKGKAAALAAAAEAARAGGYAGSVASSYWRAERKDRAGELVGLDDRFERLATQVRSQRVAALRWARKGPSWPSTRSTMACGLVRSRYRRG